MTPAERIEQALAAVEEGASPSVLAACREAVGATLDLHGEAIARLLEIVDEHLDDAAAVLRAVVDDPTIGPLLALHGLHPVPASERVRRAVEEIATRLASHGAAVSLASVDDTAARIEIDAPPAALEDLRALVHEAVVAAAPDLVDVQVIGPHDGRATLPLLLDPA